VKINNRLKLIRVELGLSQDKFATSINLARNSVALMESGDRGMSERTISDICRVHNVNSNWLLTGEGEMFNELTADDELAIILSSLLSQNDSPDRAEFKKRFITKMLQMPDPVWDHVENAVIELTTMLRGTENTIESIKKETSD